MLRDPIYQGVVPVEERSRYTVAFAADGTFAATADCNQVVGTWTATPEGGLDITPGASGIVICGEGSQGDLYILGLTNVASYVIADATLTMTTADAGTLGYEPTP
jgi:heat shock protein HslJ